MQPIKLFGLLMIFSVGCSAPNEGGADDQEVALSSTIVTETHVFEELADGVYFATSTGIVNIASNALVVVNDEDVLVVDSHITADAARELLKSIAVLTPKPVKYLVNTHFHFDHAHGNQVFPADATIIGHRYTRQKLMEDPLSGATYQVIGSPAAQSVLLSSLGESIEASDDSEARAALEQQKAALERHIIALEEVIPTPPTLTFEDRMSVRSGDREIQLLHLGRGHTAGDVVVYLPAERVMFTGDLLYPGAPYLGDGFADEFPDTLERVKALEVDYIAGGHGALMRDKLVIERSQAYLRMYWNQVEKSHATGLTVSEAVESMDFSGYEDFAVFQLGSQDVLKLEVGRMYERLDELASN
tara:strand:- start:636 stop:1712 length:1077 start_codon:yes stop_codon:yes gene_type:complete